MAFWNRLLKKKQKKSSLKKLNPPSEILKEIKNEQINYQETVKQLNEYFKEDFDFKIREFEVSGIIPATLIYLSSMVDKEVIGKEILQPLMSLTSNKEELKQVETFLLKKCLFHADIQKTNQLISVIDNLLKGSTVLLVNGIQEAILIDTKKIEKRSIAQPETEQVIRGPRDGFIESLETNICLIRNRLPIPDLRVKKLQIGEITKSNLCLFYINGITNCSLIKDVEKRLSKITIDRILDAGYVEQFIQDNPRSPFPQVKNTERPDVAVGNLLEGRVILMVDGSPFALILPATFAMFYQSSEDYNERTIMMSFVRMIRLVSIVFSLITPSVYVTILSYHPELIPTAFAVAITSGRASVPFPAVIEVFIMEAAMEILREATVRMPKQVGGALSIVGVLVVGQAAVMAGFVSPITVVVIAITTIGSFSTPAYNMATGFRMLRFPLLIASGVLGVYGLILGLVLIMNHIISLKSFGVPYFTPFSPMNWDSLKDAAIRAPLRWLLDRPEELYVSNQRRVVNPKKKPTTNPLGPENLNRKKGVENERAKTNNSKSSSNDD